MSYLLILIGFFGGALLIITVYWIQRSLKRRSIRVRFKKGKKLETKASAVLKRKGYKVLQTQVPVVHHFKVNGQDTSVQLYADYLVMKKKKKYLVEVKSGLKVNSVFHKDTRRQLLEYHVSNPHDGLLFLDMTNNDLHVVEF